MTLRPSPRTRLLLAVLALSTVVGLVAVKLNTSGRLQVAAATTHALVDYPDPSIVTRRAEPQHVSTLQKRAELFGRVIATAPVLERIGRHAGIPPDQIGGTARTTASVPLTLTEPGSEERASQIRDSQLPYRLELQADPLEPILAIYSQAPSTAQAERLANASIAGLQEYLRDLASRQGFPESEVVRIRQLGQARGGVVSGHVSLIIGALTFTVAFGISCAVLLGLIHLRRRRLGQYSTPSPTPQSAPRGGEDDWPRTKRVLPWMLAAFIAVLWLVPFNSIELGISAPIDLKLDRLLLPFLVVTWLLAFAVRGRLAPRLNMTWIHVALGAFVACAFLSVVLDAQYLNQTLELDLVLKRLPLLVSYVTFFVIVASTVRPTEVRPFLTYTLVLAVICGIGLIYQYRTNQNLFSIWSDRLLPGIFQFVGDPTEGTIDSLGRRGITGPAQVGLEVATMLSMALPVALIGLLRRGGTRDWIIYLIAACVLVAAIFVTERKIALVATLAVVLTMAYFRRREVLSLAPVGLVIAVVVSAVAPGAIHNTISQFLRPDAATVGTVSGRTADYDAVRPDVWTHLLFGRGYGSYNHETYRILDSEVLHRTVETGAIGLVAFLLVGLSVVLAARKTIARRDPTFAPLALAVAPAGVCFLVVSTLFDVLSFPHATYIFLYMAGLTAVIVAHRRQVPSDFLEPAIAAPRAALGRALDSSPSRRQPAEAQVPAILRR